MTVLAITDDTRAGRFGRVGAGHQDGGRRRGPTRPAQDAIPTGLARAMKLQDIRTRIERKRYDVDPDAVAEAIVARLLAGGTASAPGHQCS